jgi:hypothetical protein
MNLVLLGSITRSRIVASARVMRHRQILVIQQLSAITNRAAIDVEDVDAARNRQRLRFVADAASHHQRRNPGAGARARFTGRAAGVEDAADGASGEVARSPPVSSDSEVLRHSSLRFLAVRMSERSGLGW